MNRTPIPHRPFLETPARVGVGATFEPTRQAARLAIARAALAAAPGAPPPGDPDGWDFCFTRGAGPRVKPRLFQSEAALVAFLDTRVIRGRKVELVPAVLYPPGRLAGLHVTALYPLAEDGRAEGFLGYAHNRGRDWRRLQDLLFSRRPFPGAADHRRAA